MTSIQRNRTHAQRTKSKHREARSELGRPAIERGGVAGLPMLRTSERSTFKRCHWKWWWEFEEVLKPKTDVPPLRFGSLVHKALADYYKPGIKRGPKPAASFRKYYDQELKLQEQFGFRVPDVEADEIWVEAGTLGEAMLTHYIEHYGADDEWEVIVTEQPFEQIIYQERRTDKWPYSKREPLFIYVGILDGIWRNRRSKKLSIVDHKTAKAINVMYLALDLQATGYWTWGLDWIYEKGLLKPNEKPAGMLYNHLRKALPDSRPYELVNGRRVHLNKDGAYSKQQPPAYFVRTPIYRDWHEREEARYQVLAEFNDMARIRAEGSTDQPPTAAYKNQGQFTCPGCWLFDACELHEIGADWHEMLELSTRNWDPYSEHEVYRGETK